jgi:hypothetical protein
MTIARAPSTVSRTVGDRVLPVASICVRSHDCTTAIVRQDRQGHCPYRDRACVASTRQALRVSLFSRPFLALCTIRCESAQTVSAQTTLVLPSTTRRRRPRPIADMLGERLQRLLERRDDLELAMRAPLENRSIDGRFLGPAVPAARAGTSATSRSAHTEVGYAVDCSETRFLTRRASLHRCARGRKWQDADDHAGGGDA